MSTAKILATVAVLAAFGVYGCTSSDNEPQDPPEIEQPETPETPAVGKDAGVGLSKKRAFLRTNHPDLPDTIEVATDDWVISSVSFCEARYFAYPYHFPQTTYVTDISGSAPFDETVSWLHMKYEEGLLVLSDVDPFDSDDWPEYRFAFVEFERNGEVADTLMCLDESATPMGFNGLGPDPNNVFFPKEGCSVTLKTRTKHWAFHWLEVDGVRHDFGEGDPTYFHDESTWVDFDFAYTMEWVTVERNKFGGGQEEITVTVTPNDTGREREFSFGIGAWAVWGVFSGHQSAE